MAYPTYQATATADYVTATAASAVITYAANSTSAHVISGIAYSYGAAAAAGSLKIEDGTGTVIFNIDLISAAAANGVFIFNPAKRGTVNTALIITLTTGGAGVVGKLNVLSHWLASYG